MDVAALNLSIDSSSVVTAANDLDRFAAAAERAAAKSSRLNFGGASASLSKLEGAASSIDAKLSKIIGSLDKIARTSKAAAASNDNMATSASKAGASLAAADAHVIAYTQHLAGLAAAQRMADAHVQAFQNHVSASGRAMQQADAHVQAYTEHMRQLAATKPIPADTPTMITKTGDAARLAGHHVSNMAYQVNDIIVSLASGQNPLMVFIQQGSQIGQIYGQSGLTLKNFALAVVGMLAPLTPLIIALGLAATALAALTSQARDDSGLKKYTTAMGYTKAEVEKLNAVTVTYGDTMRAVFQVGMSRIASLFGVNADYMKKKWEGFLDFMVSATRASIAATYAVLTSGIYTMQAAIENAQSGKSFNPFQAIQDGLKKGYGDAQKFMDDVIKQAGANARGRQDAMAASFADPTSKGAKTASTPKRDPWADLLKDLDNEQRAIEQAGDRIGLYGQDLDRVTKTQELFNRGIEAGAKITKDGTIELTEQGLVLQTRAQLMAKTLQDNRVAEFNDTLTRSFDQQMAALRQEQGEIGLTGAALYAYRYEQEQLNLAKAAGLDQDPKVIKSIRDQAAAYGDLAASNDLARKAIEEQQRAMEANKAIVKGFFTDWINGAREGANVFKAFEKAILRALDNIIDKLIEAAIEQMFFNSVANSGGGAGGVASGIVSLIGGLFADGGTFGAAQKYASGGAFDHAQRFASGGAFTNKIYSTPTLFKFANGAKLGMMGEEGPEAVMPLTRGPNGKLGVQAHGGSAGRGPVNVTNEITNHYSVQGGFMPDAVMALIRQGGEETYAQVRRQLESMLAELDQNGTMV